jgi:hypothetical protein
MRKRTKWILVLLIVLATGPLAVSAGWWLLRERGEPQTVYFPADEEVAEVTASLTGTHKLTSVVPEFTVPAEYVPRILAPFRPAKKHDYSAELDEFTMARLVIRTKAGQTITITVPNSDKNKLCYRLDGIRCVRGGQYGAVLDSDQGDGLAIPESGFLSCSIAEMWNEQKSGEKSKQLQLYLEFLERSIGARPSTKGRLNEGRP